MFEYSHLCLSDLIDQDLTSFEYFNTLSTDMKANLMNSDVTTFEEMQKFVNKNI